MTAHTFILNSIKNAQDMLLKGFNSKADQKRALDQLSRAYSNAKDSLSSIINVTLYNSNKAAIEANGGTRIADMPTLDMPLDLHQWNVKRKDAAHELAESINADMNVVTVLLNHIDSLLTLRNTIKAEPVQTAAERAAAKKEAITAMVTASPIAAAIEPLRALSVNNAECKARSIIADAHKELAAGGYDLKVVAPRPSRKLMATEEYEQMTAKRVLFASLTDRASSSDADSEVCVQSDSAEARFIEQAKASASFEFDKYVIKMVEKVGDVTSAELDSRFSNNLWSYSILNVVTVGGEQQQWKTQQIVNVSKLGKMFNQWPTRQQ